MIKLPLVKNRELIDVLKTKASREITDGLFYIEVDWLKRHNYIAVPRINRYPYDGQIVWLSDALQSFGYNRIFNVLLEPFNEPYEDCFELGTSAADLAIAIENLRIAYSLFMTPDYDLVIICTDDYHCVGGRSDIVTAVVGGDVEAARKELIEFWPFEYMEKYTEAQNKMRLDSYNGDVARAIATEQMYRELVFPDGWNQGPVSPE